MGELLFWIASGWILWLLLVYDVLWYEVHIPLVIVGNVLILTAIGFGIFDWSILLDGIGFFVFFFGMYWLAKVLVQVKYGLKEEGIGFGDVILAPYLGILLGAGVAQNTLMIDKIMLFIFFLMISGGIGLVRYVFQNKLFNKKATFLTKKMADQAVPFLPAMILGMAIVLVAHQQLLKIFGF